jgi:hypothetical protein
MAGMKGSLPFRFTHWTMVILTLVNLLWVSAPSCCCASSKCCSQGESSGKSSCCSSTPHEGKLPADGCSCCCKTKAAPKSETSCPHCAAKSDRAVKSDLLERQGASTSSSCGTSKSCSCGEVTSQPTAPLTRTAPETQNHSEAQPLALFELKWPEIRPTESPTRHNHLLAALERPVSIRFGVWRN